MADAGAPRYEIVIAPSRGWLRLDWRELWEYRDLLVILVQRDFVARYKQTLLGPLWFVLQPVLTTMLFVVVFGRFAGLPTDGIPAPLFYLCGLLGWNYFAQNLTIGGATFVNNQHLFTKVWFPRLIVPAAAIVSNLVAFAIQLLTFFAFLAYFAVFRHDAGTVQFTWLALLAPLPVLHIAALSLGLALWMAASTVKYRDLIHFNQYLVQLWMFATPIIYPLSQVPKRWEWLMWANPMSVPVEALRFCLLGRGTLDPAPVAISLALTLALLVTGTAAFQNCARTAADSV
jgi:lipopolysaccharide transport system permease protein